MTDQGRSQMVVECSLGKDVAVLRVSGRIGEAESDELEKQFQDVLESGYCKILLEMENLEFLTSSALGVLIATLRQLRPRGGFLRLVRPQPLVLDILRTTKMTKLLAIFPSIEDALNAE